VWKEDVDLHAAMPPPRRDSEPLHCVGQAEVAAVASEPAPRVLRRQDPAAKIQPIEALRTE
jgi:hypothetical protein